MMEAKQRKKLLLLTLVHPDFLPPVYAIAQTLRDFNYDVHILTFDSLVPSDFNPGAHISVEPLGQHHKVGTLERFKLKGKFSGRVKQLVNDAPQAIIAFCPFSYLQAIKHHGEIPVCYVAMEIANYSFEGFKRSPFTQLGNYRAIKQLHKAAFLANPSVQRSAWMAGRANLQNMPFTILNTSYYEPKHESNSVETFRNLLPLDYHDKQIILYTGNVNYMLCVKELVQAFVLLDNANTRLVVTGMKDNDYCNEIRQIAASHRCPEHIKLLPYVTRNELIALQENSHVGACLFREESKTINAKMIAPNKLGEYLNKGLFVVGVRSEFMMQFEHAGVAYLAAGTQPVDITEELKRAVATTSNNSFKARISSFIQNEFCMQQQAKPLIHFLSTLK